MSETIIPFTEIGASNLSRLREAILSGGSDPLVALFEAAGCGAPMLVWNPGPANVRHPVLRRAFDALHEAADARGRVPESWLRSEAFGAIAPHAMVLDILSEGRDFRYSHYGTEIADAYGRDMTGARTSAFGGHISLFFMALYQAVLQRGEMLKSVHEPPAQVFVRVWRRLIVPLHDGSGRIVRLLGVNVPDNDLRAGLDALPDPVLVADAEGQVCYCNRVGSRLFGGPGGTLPRGSLSEVIGTPVDLPASPEDLVRSGTLHVTSKALVRHALLMPVRLTIGATFYRHTPFFVVTVQPRD